MCVGCDAHKVRNVANSQAMASQNEFGAFNLHLPTYNYSTIIMKSTKVQTLGGI